MRFQGKKVDAAPMSKRTAMSKDEFFARVQKKAYELFQKRGFSHGNDLDDWLEAEKEVKKELGIR